MMTWLTTTGVYIVLVAALLLAGTYLFLWMSRYQWVKSFKHVPAEALKERVGRPSKLRAEVTDASRVTAPLSQRQVGYAHIIVEELLADGAYEAIAELRLGDALRLSEGGHTIDVRLSGARVVVTRADAITTRDVAELPPGERDALLSSTVGSEAWNSRDLKSRPH